MSQHSQTDGISPPPLPTPSQPSTSRFSGSASGAPTMDTAATSIVEGEGSTGNGEGSKHVSEGSEQTYHALELASFIYNVGYLSQEWADIQLSFFNSVIKLHRVVLARSPYLARMMLPHPPGSSIHLNFSDENITEDAVYIVLQHLYNPSLTLVNSQNARGVLATSFLFENMPQLTHHAYTILRDSISSSTVLDYVEWLSSSPAPSHPNGEPVGAVHMPGSTIGEASWSEDGHPRYSEWSVRLKGDVTDFLIRVLPESILSSPAPSLSSNPTLTGIYTKLPFDLFKHCIESPSFPIEKMQDRFGLAKHLISLRKKTAIASKMEETAVLAFKNERMEVFVARKPKRARAPLWKVEG